QGAGRGRVHRHSARRRERRRRRVGAPRRHAPRHAAHARATLGGDQETLMNYRIISADDHIDLQWLPKDLWQKRVSASWRGRAPKVVETPEGPFWFCGDDRWDPWGGRRGAAGAQGGRRTALERGGVLEPGVLRPTTAADEVRYLEQIGLRTGMFLAARVELPLWDEAWEPLWEAAAETELPVGFHLGGGLRTVAFSGPKATQAGNMGVRVACSTLQ